MCPGQGDQAGDLLGKELGKAVGCFSGHQAQPGQGKAFPGDKVPSLLHQLLHSLVPPPHQGATMPWHTHTPYT